MPFFHGSRWFGFGTFGYFGVKVLCIRQPYCLLTILCLQYLPSMVARMVSLDCSCFRVGPFCFQFIVWRKEPRGAFIFHGLCAVSERKSPRYLPCKQFFKAGSVTQMTFSIYVFVKTYMFLNSTKAMMTTFYLLGVYSDQVAVHMKVQNCTPSCYTLRYCCSCYCTCTVCVVTRVRFCLAAIDYDVLEYHTHSKKRFKKMARMQLFLPCLYVCDDGTKFLTMHTRLCTL